MGYPHKPHAKETVVLSKHFGDAEARSLKGWVKRGGYDAWKQAQAMTPLAIMEEVKNSGLRGRGGAGFPTGLKWSFMPKEKKKPHYLCVNADESAAGVFGMPTTINNVETLAAVPLILKNGAAWYKAMTLSNPKSTGTKLFSVCGNIQKPGNYEVTMGFPLKDLLYDMCGGVPKGRTLKACIPGGSSVPILNREETESCLLDYEGAVEKGTMLGSGGVIVFDDSADMVYQIMRVARFYAHESCAQCTQCREGTAWTTKILQRILAGQGKTTDLDLLLDLSENMTGKTICVLSDSCAAPVVSGIKKFRGEFEEYLNGRRKPVVAA